MDHWLVFTDLDGTLLDHHTYSFQAAEPAIQRLQSLGIPIILNSSKTVAELDEIAQQLSLPDPLIAENGSLIVIPGESPVLWGPDYGAICQLLDEIRAETGWSFSCFHDWSAEQVAEHTGLPMDSARLAAQRQASEPMIWQGEADAIDQLRQRLEANGLQLKRGGRFWHVMGQTDKVKAMQYLADRQQRLVGGEVKVIALGDGPNDISMLEAADVAVIVHNPESDEIHVTPREGQRLLKTVLPGPAGWNAAIQEILDHSGTE